MNTPSPPTKNDALSNQADKMTDSTAASLPLFLAMPVFTQWAHEQSSHGVRDEGFVWIQQHGLPLIKADLLVISLRDQR